MARKKIMMVLPPQGFSRDVYVRTRQVLEGRGHTIFVTAINRGAAVSDDGMSVPIDERIVDVKTYQYDAYVFIGGDGTRIYFDDEYVHKLASDVKSKTVGAIGNAAMILARAEVLKKKKVTGPSEFAGYVIEGGGEYTGRPLEIDGKMITLRDTSIVEQFANALAESVE